MNPKVEQIEQVFIEFRLGFYGFYQREMIELFSYRSKAFADGHDIKYYWSSWNKGVKNSVIQETYERWLTDVVQKIAVMNWEIKSEYKGD